MVLRFIRALPGDRPVTGLVCHRHRAKLASRNLASASGGQDHTISPSAEALANDTRRTRYRSPLFLAKAASRARQALCPRPSHPASDVRDDRETPLVWRRDKRDQITHFRKTEAEYFSREGWTLESPEIIVELLREIRFIAHAILRRSSPSRAMQRRANARTGESARSPCERMRHAGSRKHPGISPRSSGPR